MLFHVTATHSADNCPGYNRELMPPMLEAFEGSRDLATELGIKVHLWLAPLPSMCRTYFWKPKIVYEYRYGQTRFLINRNSTSTQ